MTLLITILKWLEYGLYKKCILVLSKIIFYLVQDGYRTRGACPSGCFRPGTTTCSASRSEIRSAAWRQEPQEPRVPHGAQLPGRPVVCTDWLFLINYGLVWGIVASSFGATWRSRYQYYSQKGASFCRNSHTNAFVGGLDRTHIGSPTSTVDDRNPA